MAPFLGLVVKYRLLSSSPPLVVFGPLPVLGDLCRLTALAGILGILLLVDLAALVHYISFINHVSWPSPAPLYDNPSTLDAIGDFLSQRMGLQCAPRCVCVAVCVCVCVISRSGHGVCSRPLS